MRRSVGLLLILLVCVGLFAPTLLATADSTATDQFLALIVELETLTAEGDYTSHQVAALISQGEYLLSRPDCTPGEDILLRWQALRQGYLVQTLPQWYGERMRALTDGGQLLYPDSTRWTTYASREWAEIEEKTQTFLTVLPTYTAQQIDEAQNALWLAFSALPTKDEVRLGWETRIEEVGLQLADLVEAHVNPARHQEGLSPLSIDPTTAQGLTLPDALAACYGEDSPLIDLYWSALATAGEDLYASTEALLAAFEGFLSQMRATPFQFDTTLRDRDVAAARVKGKLEAELTEENLSKYQEGDQAYVKLWVAQAIASLPYARTEDEVDSIWRTYADQIAVLPAKQVLNPWLWVAIVSGALAVALLVVYIVRRRRTPRTNTRDESMALLAEYAAQKAAEAKEAETSAFEVEGAETPEVHTEEENEVDTEEENPEEDTIQPTADGAENPKENE